MPTEGLVADSRDPQVFDATLRLMHFTSPSDGSTIGTIVNWADHPETTWAENTEVTADFPGYLRDILENGIRVDGQRVVSGLGGMHVYVNGAIGGLMTTNPETKVPDVFAGQEYALPSHDKARAVGRRLGEAILTTLMARPSAPESSSADRRHRADHRAAARQPAVPSRLRRRHHRSRPAALEPRPQRGRARHDR